MVTVEGGAYGLTHMRRRFASNGPKLETAQMSFTRWVGMARRPPWRILQTLTDQGIRILHRPFQTIEEERTAQFVL